MGNLTLTKSGSLVSFHSPTEADIQSLKVYFSAKQEGSGDPSPENVRNISGWTSATAYHNSKIVQWNQWLRPLTSDNWKAYSTYNTVTFSDGIATSEWLEQKTGYSASVVNKVGTAQSAGQIWYVSYMVKPSVAGLKWSVEFDCRNELCDCECK